MTDADALLRDADKKLERNEYAAARDAYRAAILAGGFGLPTSSNIDVAQSNEYLEFLHTVRERHPDSIESALAEARHWLGMRREASALAIATALLGRGLGDQDTIRVRSFRYSAGARHGAETMPDDFEFIWRLGETDERAKPFRRGLLREILRIDRPEAIAALQSIVARIQQEPDVAAVITLKIRELESFASLKESLAPKRNASVVPE